MALSVGTDPDGSYWQEMQRLFVTPRSVCTSIFSLNDRVLWAKSKRGATPAANQRAEEMEPQLQFFPLQTLHSVQKENDME